MQVQQVQKSNRTAKKNILQQKFVLKQSKSFQSSNHQNQLKLIQKNISILLQQIKTNYLHKQKKIGQVIQEVISQIRQTQNKLSFQLENKKENEINMVQTQVYAFLIDSKKIKKIILNNPQQSQARIQKTLNNGRQVVQMITQIAFNLNKFYNLSDKFCQKIKQVSSNLSKYSVEEFIQKNGNGNKNEDTIFQKENQNFKPQVNVSKENINISSMHNYVDQSNYEIDEDHRVINNKQINCLQKSKEINPVMKPTIQEPIQLNNNHIKKSLKILQNLEQNNQKPVDKKTKNSYKSMCRNFETKNQECKNGEFVSEKMIVLTCKTQSSQSNPSKSCKKQDLTAINKQFLFDNKYQILFNYINKSTKINIQIRHIFYQHLDSGHFLSKNNMKSFIKKFINTFLYIDKTICLYHSIYEQNIQQSQIRKEACFKTFKIQKKPISILNFLENVKLDKQNEQQCKFNYKSLKKQHFLSQCRVSSNQPILKDVESKQLCLNLNLLKSTEIFEYQKQKINIKSRSSNPHGSSISQRSSRSKLNCSQILRKQKYKFQAVKNTYLG